MDIASVLADLRSQRDNLKQAIMALEQLSLSRPRRRGRPRTNFHAITQAANEAALGTPLHRKAMANSGS